MIFPVIPSPLAGEGGGEGGWLMSDLMIDGQEPKFFYDEDQLKNGMLSKYSDEQKIEWFRERLLKIYFRPLQQIINSDPKAYNPLWQSDKDFMMAAFSIMLNGIDSLGAFVSQKGNHERFKIFLKKYMNKAWTEIENQLWHNFRSPMAHGFNIEDGAILYRREDKRRFWYDEKAGKKWLVVDPGKFLTDLEKAIDLFFEDIYKNEILQILFLERFHTIYPCR